MARCVTLPVLTLALLLPAAAPAHGVSVITPSLMARHIAALADDSMRGRDARLSHGWGKSTVVELVRRLAAEHRELGLEVGPDPEDRPETPSRPKWDPASRRLNVRPPE